MCAYDLSFFLIFWGNLLAGGRGYTLQKRHNPLSTQIHIGIKAHPVSAAQTNNTLVPNVVLLKPFNIETPLPWPHPELSTHHSTAPEPTPQGKTIPSLSSSTTTSTSTPTLLPRPHSYSTHHSTAPKPRSTTTSTTTPTPQEKTTPSSSSSTTTSTPTPTTLPWPHSYSTQHSTTPEPRSTTTSTTTPIPLEKTTPLSSSSTTTITSPTTTPQGTTVTTPTTAKKKPHSWCFPAISRVTLQSGANIRMRQLRIGDKVRTLGTNGITADTEVISFLHKETKTEAEFYKLETSGRNAVILSPEHLIFRKENPTSPISVVFASEIKLGNLLYTSNGSVSEYKAVTRISMATDIGVYAPLTSQGTLLVDGILVSCYATWPSHDEAHFAMAPLRGWKRLTSFMDWTIWTNYQQTDGISWYALALMALTNIFL